jgi:signal transduction histidine kinase
MPFSGQDEKSSPAASDALPLLPRPSPSASAERLAALTCLVDLSRTLAEAGLDLDEVLRAVARQVAITIGDACAVQLLAPDGQLTLAATAHRDLAAQALFHQVFPELAAPTASPALRTDGVIRHLQICSEPASLVGLSEEARAYLRRFPLLSGFTLGLRIRGEPMGALTIWRSGSVHSALEQELLLEVADRAALAIDAAQRHQALDLDCRRLHAVIKQMPCGFAIVEAPSGRPVVRNDQQRWNIFRQVGPVISKIADYAGFRGFHPDGRPIRAEEWALARSIRTGEVVRGEEVNILRGDGTRGVIRLNSAPVRNERGDIVAGVVTYDDITETHQARRALEHQRSLFHSLLSQVPAVINFLRGPQLIFEFAHPLTIQSLGGREVTGKPLLEAIPEHSGQPFYDMLQSVFTTGQPCSGQERLARVDRTNSGQLEDSYWNFDYLPVRGIDGRVEGVMTFDVEVTEQVLARKKVEAVAAQLQLASAERERLIEDLSRTVRFSEMFVGILGHDLRNPLSAIMTAASTLERRADNDRVAKRAARILNSANRMGRMIDQILDFTRIRLGQGLPLACKRVDLAEICRLVVDEFEGGGTAGVNLGTQGSALGVWDPDRLSQLVSNLLGNALEHGRQGAPVGIEIEGSDPGQVSLTVTNAGALPPELVPIIFEPFRAGKDRKHQGSSGLGLGLFITQQIALAHGGTIDLRPADGEGTTFVVKLPRRRPEQPHPQGAFGR